MRRLTWAWYEQARERAEAAEMRKRRAVEAVEESIARGSMRLPKLGNDV